MVFVKAKATATGILPEFSKFYCHPGKAGGTPGILGMNNRTLGITILLFAMLSATSQSQTPDKPAPGFTLTIRGHALKNGGYGLKGLELITTNISKEAISKGVCRPLEFDKGFSVEVLYKGVRLEMDETSPAVRQLRAFQKEPWVCQGSVMGHLVLPGKADKPEGSFSDPLIEYHFYDMSKPGNYEIAVTEETLPNNPEKSVTVRSNTVTVVVPEPGAVKPN